MKSFFRGLSSRFPFFANRPSALERAVRSGRPSPKSRSLRMEPLENRALLAVDAFGASAASADSGVDESWGPDPAPAAFSASVLASDAAPIDVSGVSATLDATSFSVQNATPTPLAPPSFDQLMESLGMIEIESLADESAAASASFLDDASESTQVLETQAEARQVVFYDSSAADFDASTLNLDDASVCYVDVAERNATDAESYSITSRSGGESSGSGGSSITVPVDCHLTTYGSSTIHESATFNGSGGSDDATYFGFTTPSIPSGYWAYVRFGSSDTILDNAVYGQDYYIASATINNNGVVTPNTNYVSGGQNPDGTYDLYVYGPASYCVVPFSDTLNESFEGLQATFYLVDMMSGGANYDPTPINCGSFNATIVDDGVEYYYETVITATTPTRESLSETDAPEWTVGDFENRYNNPLENNPAVLLEEIGLADDYQRATISGENLAHWEAMELNAQAALLADLRNQEANWESLGSLNPESYWTYEESVARDVTNVDNLRYYGKGNTDVFASTVLTEKSRDETPDAEGRERTKITYSAEVAYSCNVFDTFADFADWETTFEYVDGNGTPYMLNGSYVTNGAYEVTVTITRYEVE